MSVSRDLTPKHDDAGTAATSADPATNKWDVWMTVVVTLGLLGLVWLLTREYSKSGDVTAVLGVAAPVLAAAFGLSIGYYGGQKAGTAAGKANGKAETRNALRDDAVRLEGAVHQVMGQFTAAAESPAGTDDFIVGAASRETTHVPHADVRDVYALAGQLRGKCENS